MKQQAIDLSGPVKDRQEKVTTYLRRELEEASIDEILRGLIDGSGMSEIVACIDMIAQEHQRRVVLREKAGRVYPHKDIPLTFPESPQKAPIDCSGASIDYPLQPPKDQLPEGLCPISQVYKGGFFKNRHKLEWRAPIVGKALIDIFSLTNFSHTIDVGCAIGEYVKWLTQYGVDAWGIEGSPAAKEFLLTERVMIMDLRKSIESGPFLGRYDLAYSLEVAEHIEPEYAGMYLDNLCRLSDTILMTAAHPGQKGHGHVNCQEKGWWAAEMQNRNYKRDYNMERLWQEALRPWNHRKEVAVYAKNVMIFKTIHIGGF